jgi:hypothetical protein
LLGLNTPQISKSRRVQTSLYPQQLRRSVLKYIENRIWCCIDLVKIIIDFKQITCRLAYGDFLLPNRDPQLNWSIHRLINLRGLKQSDKVNTAAIDRRSHAPSHASKKLVALQINGQQLHKWSLRSPILIAAFVWEISCAVHRILVVWVIISNHPTRLNKSAARH